MIRLLILAVVLGFALIGVIALVRLLLQGSRDQRDRARREKP